MSFYDALRQVKQGGRVGGKTPKQIQAETKAVSEGYFANVNEKNARAEQLKNQKAEIDQRKTLTQMDIDAAASRQAETLAADQAKWSTQLAEQKRSAQALETQRAKELSEAKSTREAQMAAAEDARASEKVGTFIEYGLGALEVASSIKSSFCIIVTACTDRYSPEVDITREFRDRYMGPTSLAGYYRVAQYVVPIIERVNILKRLTKKVLVDRLIDYGEWILEKKGRRKYRTSRMVANLFLDLCSYVGVRNGNI